MRTERIISFNGLKKALSSSKNEGNQKLKLVLELLSQSKTIESVLHVGCRIQSWEVITLICRCLCYKALAGDN